MYFFFGASRDDGGRYWGFDFFLKFLSGLRVGLGFSGFGERDGGGLKE